MVNATCSIPEVNQRPNCKCHDMPMYANNSNGGWRCAVLTNIRNRVSRLHGERRRVLQQLEEINGSD